MCNPNCLRFVAASLGPEDVAGRRILEVGAYDVNGSPRSVLERMDPASYLGVDIVEGPGVDEICSVDMLVQKYGPGAFDVVISTEMIEHVAAWREAVSNLKRVTAPEGVIVLTTRSKGFPLHDYPADHWRFEPHDMRMVFADCAIEHLERDAPEDPGVFVKARKPADFRELDLEGYALYSMVSERREMTTEDAARSRADAVRLRDLEDQRRRLETDLAAQTLELERISGEAAAVTTELRDTQRLKVLRYTAPLRRVYGSARTTFSLRHE
jgi:SAM-dependent methyltransferase